ncbi:MAG: DUF4350 domain-containing protein [Gammaproteobacteria bacterium]|nr:DUF4350 domain-containing protein [Gammaproteobacteria bacterium]MDH3449208.1 DUF4350 domain-containing protein [Gammaproteobacteria bacterium]
MKRNRVPVKPVLGLILVALLGWVVYASIEFYDETQQSGWSTEALRNPYLAAQQFMTRSGIDITDVDNLSRLDELGSIGTLFFSDANQVQAPRQLEQVIGWLELGGNVIYAANSVAHDDDLLLREFEVEVDWREFDADQESEDRSLSQTMREYNRQIEEGKSREEIARDFGGEEISLTRVSFGDEIGVLEVAFDNDKILQHPYIADPEYDAGGSRPFSWSNSDYGVHMMQFEVGSGLLTIVSDPQVWTSYQIDRHDHAYLLWLLSAADGNFAILRSVVRDSIWVLIRRNATELLIAAGLLILVWVWHSGYRFGRLLPRDQSRMRALGEYFSSVSHYLWHRRHGDYLITPLRQQVLRRASLTLGEFSRADEAGQYRLMAQHCDLNPGAVARAFSDENFSEATFVQTVRLLKRIEQSL